MKKKLFLAEEIAFRAEKHAIVFLIVVVVLVASGQVFGRYVLDYAPEWCEELARYLFVWVVFLGAPLGVRERGHMAIMLVVEHLPPGWKRLSCIFIYMVAGAFLAILTWQGISIMIETGAEVSPTMEISMAWVYGAVPLGSLLMLFHLAVSFFKRGLLENPLFSFEG